MTQLFVSKLLLLGFPRSTGKEYCDWNISHQIGRAVHTQVGHLVSVFIHQIVNLQPCNGARKTQSNAKVSFTQMTANFVFYYLFILALIRIRPH